MARGGDGKLRLESWTFGKGDWRPQRASAKKNKLPRGGGEKKPPGESGGGAMKGGRCERAKAARSVREKKEKKSRFFKEKGVCVDIGQKKVKREAPRVWEQGLPRKNHLRKKVDSDGGNRKGWGGKKGGV